MSDLAALGVVEAAGAIQRGALSPVALVDACLERIRALDGDVQAWVHVDETGARAAARERAEEARRSTVRGPLRGVPIQLVQAAGASARLLSVAAWCERRLAFSRSPGL